MTKLEDNVEEKIHENRQEENVRLAGQFQEAQSAERYSFQEVQSAELQRTWRGTEMKEILEENTCDLKLSCEVSNSKDKERLAEFQKKPVTYKGRNQKGTRFLGAFATTSRDSDNLIKGPFPTMMELTYQGKRKNILTRQDAERAPASFPVTHGSSNLTKIVQSQWRS